MTRLLCVLRVAAFPAALAVVAASCSNPVEAEKSVPDIWGVWIGFGDANPEFRNTPYPASPDFTEWGAAESERLATVDRRRITRRAGRIGDKSAAAGRGLRCLRGQQR